MFSFKLVKSVDDHLKKTIKAIRYWDTWMWKKENFKRSLYLNIVFKYYGIKPFIDKYSKLFDYCLEKEGVPFEYFDTEELDIIKNRLNFLDELYESLVVTNFTFNKNDSIFADYKDIKDVIKVSLFMYNGNDISYLSNKILEENNSDICMCINTKYNSVSLRSKEDDDSGLSMSKIAEFHNGGGHLHASGYSLTNKDIDFINKRLTDTYKDIF